MAGKNRTIADILNRNSDISRLEGMGLVLSLSLPAILAQITTIGMEYIDAAMVGSLGAAATAAIGIVSTTIWLISGMCMGLVTGFTVQVAQLVGAGREKEAAGVAGGAFTVMAAAACLLSCLSLCISGSLPGWLGAEKNIQADSVSYFRIFAMTIPLGLLRQLCAGIMQCSGDLRTPSILSSLVCVLDVIFNMFFIFSARTVALFGFEFEVPGLGCGVTGAALGTAASEAVVAALMLYFLLAKNRVMRDKKAIRFIPGKKTLLAAAKVAVPMTFDHIFMCTAYVAGTLIVAPLGTVALAANSLAVTAESLCYMPGYGISSASTAIIGQTIGAGRENLTRRFSSMCALLGMLLMGGMAVVMYAFAGMAFSMLTSDAAVAALGTKVLRIELFAEPLYGASIVCAGVFRGAGDTLCSSIMNLVSMWGVRIVLAALLTPRMGLSGYWLAMCLELCVRGLLFLWRLKSGRWRKKALV